MKVLPILSITALILSYSGHASAESRRGSEIKFGPGGCYKGYFARPTANGPFPGIVVIHEWWGLNEYIRAEADKLAGMGYATLAVDLFGRSTTDPKLAAAVIYYGRPVTNPEELKRVKAAVMGIYGEADQSIPMTDVKAFDRALTEAGVRHEIHTYPGAGHAFANPSGGERYKPDAAADAWRKTTAFLARYLK